MISPFFAKWCVFKVKYMVNPSRLYDNQPSPCGDSDDGALPRRTTLWQNFDRSAILNDFFEPMDQPARVDPD